MIKIAIFNQKGGVGKTLTTINLAGCFSMLGKKVMVVDCDAQANCTDCFTVYAEKKVDKTIYDCMRGDCTIEDALIPVKTKFRKKIIDTNISLLPNDDRIDFLDTSEEDYKKLSKLLEPLESEYDYCFFDCPPQRTNMMIVALCASDYVLVPIQPDLRSIKGYGMILDLIEDLKVGQFNETLEIIGIVMIGVIERNSLDRYFIDEFGKDFKSLIFKSKIRNATVVEHAYTFGNAVCYYAPREKVAEDFMKLAQEIEKRIQVKNRK